MDDQSTLFLDALRAALSRWDVAMDSAQAQLLWAHYSRMIEVNQVMNLTRVTEPVEAAIKHYADSLAVLPCVREREFRVENVLDVGTGAGFPAVPIAVLRRDWAVTAIDGTAKKARFVASMAEELSLPNLHAVHAHSVHWSAEEPFTLVLARATGPLGKCLAQVAGHAARGGVVIVFKTAHVDASERKEAQALARELRLRALEPFAYTLELRDQRIERLLFLFRR